MTDFRSQGCKARRAQRFAALLGISILVVACSESEVPSSSNHSTYSGDIGEIHHVDSVSRVSWEWDAPEGYVLRDVLSGVGGAVMVLGDGVIGVEGETGEELWRYRLPDSSLESAAITPGGGSVVLIYRVEGEGKFDVVVLDAGTGELNGKYSSPAVDNGSERDFHLTDHARLTLSEGGGFGLSAESLENGETLWEFQEEPWASVRNFELSAASEMVVVSALRGENIAAVGLNAKTGEPLWEEKFPFEAGEGDLPLSTFSKGGETLMLEVEGGFSGVRARWFLDSLSGEEMAESIIFEDEGRSLVAFNEQGSVERMVDTGQGPDHVRVEYQAMDFDGSVREHVEFSGRPAERLLHPGIILDEGVLRLNYLTDGDLARGDVTAEFWPWSGDEPQAVPIDLAPNEELLLNMEGSINADADAPRLVSVPGAVVVTEESVGSVRAVGLA